MMDRHSISLWGALAPALLAAFAASLLLGGAAAAESGAPIPPEKFSDDYYKVYGTPDLTVSLDSSRLYQGEQSSLFLTATNRGRITSFEANEEPSANKREEMIAAQKEQELEKLRTVAQDVSVRLRAENESAIDISRPVAYPGSIREGQTSARLEFPLEAYKNAAPGQYRLYADINYTYQRDVSVEGDEDRPESPDVFYWYEPLSQTLPLILTVERKSLAEFSVLSISPPTLAAGSEDNVVKISIKNVGSEPANDLVARLRPESGIYVSVDESPIPVLEPGQEAELAYKLDVSKDAVPGKRYQLRILFEFSDPFRDDLSDWENAYLIVEEEGLGSSKITIIALLIAAALLVLAIKNRERIRGRIGGKIKQQ
jgi:hypothetical protein